jgi:bacterial/archaeal transporter family-2 protein
MGADRIASRLSRRTASRHRFATVKTRSAVLLLAPKLGAAGSMTAPIAGQILASMAIDYFGIVGFAAQPITLPRLMGALLVVVGVLVMQGPGIWRLVQSGLPVPAEN